jgi:hypothetical protein
MQTLHPAPEIAEERFDWFTYDIEADGPRSAPSTRPGSAMTASCSTDGHRASAGPAERDRAGHPFSQARLAVLRALRRAHDQRHPTG